MGNLDNNEAVQSGLHAPPESPVAATTDSPGWLPRGVVAGSLTGLILGPLTGAAACWINVSNDSLAWGSLVGAAVGLVAGLILGWMESLRRAEIARADTATLIGAVFGLLPGFQLLLIGSPNVRGRSSGYLLMGLFFIGPIIGMMIGALLDRAFDARRNRFWREAILFGALTVAASVGLGWLMFINPTGTDVADVKKTLRSMMIQKWREQPETRNATIQNVTLARDRDGVFSGRVDAIIAGQSQSFVVEVVVEGTIARAEWHPIVE